jgi:GDPmannose 4,6-dehydratase
VRQDDALLRPADIRFGAGDPSLASERIGWRASVDVDGLVTRMCEAAALA